jgi:CopG family nickel-responsive transcriptional regulator
LRKKSRERRQKDDDDTLSLRHDRNRKKSETVARISMSLPQELLSEFDRIILKAGFSDRSKAIQTALHSFIDQNTWNNDNDDGKDTNTTATITRTITGAGTIMVLYDNHTYSQDDTSIHIQHRYTDIITTTTHMHLDQDNCLETIMVRGETKRIKELANHLSKNRGIKSFKVNFVSVV